MKVDTTVASKSIIRCVKVDSVDFEGTFLLYFITLDNLISVEKLKRTSPEETAPKQGVSRFQAGSDVVLGRDAIVL